MSILVPIHVREYLFVTWQPFQKMYFLIQMSIDPILSFAFLATYFRIPRFFFVSFHCLHNILFVKFARKQIGKFKCRFLDLMIGSNP